MTRLLVVSDIHYAGPGEQARKGYHTRGIGNPLKRAAIHLWESSVWDTDHNRVFDQFLTRDLDHELIVANGDFSRDSGFIGLADVAACQSATECTQRLGDKFGNRLRLVMGDHEFGKTSLGGRGGMRLAGYEAAVNNIGIAPFWRQTIGNLEIIGVTSSLIGLPVFHLDILPEEKADWETLRVDHLRQLDSCFQDLPTNRRVLLFCHDPSALHYLMEGTQVSRILDRLEATIIGHIHSRAIFGLSRRIAGFPVVRFAGSPFLRMSTTLNRARCWKDFKVTFCPALAGTNLEPGGYLELEVNEGTGAITVSDRKS